MNAFKPKMPYQFELVAFQPAKTAVKLYFQAERQDQNLKFEFLLQGVGKVKLPALAEQPQIKDLLWEHSCFELFISAGGPRYVEFNLSPSGDWNILAFDNYRVAAKQFKFKLQIPYFRCTRDPDQDTLSVRGEIDLGQCLEFFGKDGPSTIALAATAVIEGQSGAKDYWALQHPQKAKADFHDLAGFIAKIS